MTKLFNPCMFIGTGFSYSIRGTEGTGFTVVTSVSTRKHHYQTLEKAHKGIMRAYKVFKGQSKRVICQSLQGVPLWTDGASYQVLENTEKMCVKGYLK